MEWNRMWLGRDGISWVENIDRVVVEVSKRRIDTSSSYHTVRRAIKWKFKCNCKGSILSYRLTFFGIMWRTTLIYMCCALCVVSVLYYYSVAVLVCFCHSACFAIFMYCTVMDLFWYSIEVVFGGIPWTSEKTRTTYEHLIGECISLNQSLSTSWRIRV